MKKLLFFLLPSIVLSAPQVIGRIHSDVGEEFLLRRSRLGMRGEFFKVEYDFARGTADPKDVFIGNEFFRIGHIKEPMGFEVLQSSNDIPFLERSFASSIAADRNMGLSFRKSWDNWIAEAGYFQEADGQGKTRDAQARTGRIVYSGKIHCAVSCSDRDDMVLRLNSESAFLNSTSFKFGDAQILAEEIAYQTGSLLLQGEHFHVMHHADAGYLQASYLFGSTRTYDKGLFRGTKNPGWELAARYSSGEFEKINKHSLSIGINYYVSANMRFLANFIDSGEAVFRTQVNW